ncbi:MAG: hypothetical protein MRZ64_09960 [[Bacteroides] pectinophilus]|nr:hypothetical protein [[Bacteroides] pectinophilus]
MLDFDDIGGTFIFFIIVCVVIAVVKAYLMDDAAIRKGYEGQVHAWAISFWLGIFGDIYILALPDLFERRNQEKLLNAIEKNRPAINSAINSTSNYTAYDSGTNQSQEVVADGWKCKVCGRINAGYTGTCGCGQQKINN